jgi:hypothetical protein
LLEVFPFLILLVPENPIKFSARTKKKNANRAHIENLISLTMLSTSSNRYRFARDAATAGA